MYMSTKKVHLAASEMLVPAEMHLRPAEICLVGAGMMVTAEMHLMLTEVLRRCTVARHPLMPAGTSVSHPPGIPPQTLGAFLQVPMSKQLPGTPLQDLGVPRQASHAFLQAPAFQ
jgi:hypothetical protein